MLLLASQSPRRAELLRQIQVPFIAKGVAFDESLLSNESPEQYVQRLALGKAQLGLAQSDGSLPVLGADTVAVLDGEILGKPKDQADSQRMLRALSGRTHQILTAIALVTAEQQWQKLVCTEVTFANLSDAQILAYWQSGEPADKAGSYGIQGLAAQFICQINGSYSAVVGLPLYETSQLLLAAGINNKAEL